MKIIQGFKPDTLVERAFMREKLIWLKEEQQFNLPAVAEGPRDRLFLNGTKCLWYYEAKFRKIWLQKVLDSGEAPLENGRK